MLASVVACSSDGQESVDAARDTTSSTAADRSTSIAQDEATPAGTGGCGVDPGPIPDSGALERTLDSSGNERAYLVVVPDNYDPAVPTPVLFSFHGAGSNKEEQLAYTGFAALAAEDTTLVVVPDALGGDVQRWSPYGVATHGVEGVNDLDFFEDLLDEVEASFCVDAARVGATGMSSGGYMTAAVACAYSDRIAAVGPVTATMWAEGACGDAEAMPYVYFHGTDDPTVPFLGPVPGPDGEPGPGAAETSAAEWAAHNGCDDDPVDEQVGDDVVHRHWEGCDAPTDLYIVEGGGHTWPGAIDIPRLGATTQTISATEIVWDLFQSSSRPQG
jgi:polyhydroxybutyrate depolymerase